jgi:hypothetical protein
MRIMTCLGGGIALAIAITHIVPAAADGRRPPAKRPAGGGGPAADPDAIINWSSYSSDCGTDFDMTVDVPAFRAGFDKLNLHVKTPAGEIDTFTWDEAKRDAKSNCTVVLWQVEALCKQSAYHKRVVKANVHSIRCGLEDSKTAAPQQSFKDGEWDVQYSWWAYSNVIVGVDAGLAKAIGLGPRKIDKSWEDNRKTTEKTYPRCNTASECVAPTVCAETGGGDTDNLHGPRCWDPAAEAAKPPAEEVEE